MKRNPIPRRGVLKAVPVAAAATLAACAAHPRPTLASLAIVSRPEWGAVEPDLNAPAERGLYDPETNPEGWRVYDQPLAEVLRTLVVHHSALPLSDGPREIQQLHMQNKGYADIGYHYIVDEAGHIYEGRSLAVRGAHTAGHNTGSVGVVLMGNFESLSPVEAQLSSLNLLGLALVGDFGLTHLCGHRDFQPEDTACPGRNLEPLLPGVADGLGLQFGTGGYVGMQP